MLRKTPAFLWIPLGMLVLLLDSAALADATARADTNRGVLWNWWNDFGVDVNFWLANPGGSKFTLQAKAVAPGGPLVPPAAPVFPALAVGIHSVPANAPGNKFVELPVGTAVAGINPWGGAVFGAIANQFPGSGSFAEGQAQGGSAKTPFGWLAVGRTRAEGFPSVATGRVASWGKMFDPWDFHDFEPSDPQQPGLDDFLTVTAAITIDPTLEAGASSADSAIATSRTTLEIDDIELFSFDLSLDAQGGINTFSAQIDFHENVRIFNYTLDANGDPIVGEMLDQDNFRSMVEGFFDSGSGQWNPPDGGFELLVAYDYPQPLVFFESGHVTARFEGEDVMFATAVPEPATLSLLALGGLVLVRRRR